jgi:carboxylesterase type B
MQIYKFKNIRFAAPPVGDLRWAKPAPPPTQSGIVDGSVGNKCPQAAIKGLNLVGTGDNSPIASVIDNFIDTVIQPLFSGGTEDCLFLDVFVPGSAVRSPSTSSLPVIHWFYGGGYVFGSKDMLEDATLPFYDGTGMIKQSGNNVIYVASNYRLGAFGFMAGTTMENEGLPNTGLWDQRAALQWTQDNIHLLGGDPTQVTAMGESAGAGSILHHIIAGGGTIKPLFKRAIMQSVAFQPMWDRTGALEDVYKQFEAFAGCAGQGLACLRSADTSTLLSANTALNNAVTDGTFNVGPAADGTFVRQLPALELASGNYWTDIDALLVSHTSNEGTLFVDGHVATDAEFTAFVAGLFPEVSLHISQNYALTHQAPVCQSRRSPHRHRNHVPSSGRRQRHLRHRKRPPAPLHPRLLRDLQLPLAGLQLRRQDLQHAIRDAPRLARHRPAPDLLGHRPRKQRSGRNPRSVAPGLLRLRGSV